jgi:hypothetical protein|tara:strand:- start:2655 stop:3461 length:807 start_codon:yes stop_codon:yes gene_type:complete
MNPRRNYIPWEQIDVNEVRFSLGVDRNAKPMINMVVGANCAEVALLSPACVTNWPRVTGDGNFGTMWGPTDISKAKFSLDLTDGAINEVDNPSYKRFADLMDAIDEKLLDFVQNNQLKILGRKNLSREEVKMLQIRTIRAKYDKVTGQLVGHSVQTTTSKFAWDGMGGKYARAINICDHEGAVVPNGVVAPGDVVAATIYANQIYTGVGGDKFGIHWSFEDVSVVCQRSQLEAKTSVPVFAATKYEFGKAYSDSCTQATFESTGQFSD